MWWLKFILGALILLALHGEAEAKCPFAEYEVSGVVELPENMDYGSLKIFLFVGDATFTSDYVAEDGVEHVTPNGDGRFSITSTHSTYSGISWLRRERCNRFANRAELFIVGPETRATRVEISLADQRQNLRENLESSTRLQKPIRLSAL